MTDLFSLTLNIVLVHLTSICFEGDGGCELADFGYSRDHRDDRCQEVLGLVVTQVGLPIIQRLFPAITNDVTTLAPIALRERFGLPEAVLVGDKGMFSDANLNARAEVGFRYVLALRNRSDQRATTPSGAPSVRTPGAKAPRTLAPPAGQARAGYKLIEVELVKGPPPFGRLLTLQGPLDYKVRQRRFGAEPGGARQAARAGRYHSDTAASG